MAITEFSAAINQVATERGIPVENVLETIRMALATAYRKDFGGDLENIEVELNPDTGEAKILRDGEDVTPSGFGRIAAQTAKQVILQKIRETEKEIILDEYKEKLGTIMQGTIFRIDSNVIILDLGKAQGVLPQSEQVDSEEYRINQRIKILVKDVRQGGRGTEIIVSRSDPDFVVRLFEQEVPEIASGVVTIEAIAREAGSRTKMAVSSSDEKIDPVGSCVGQKGVRVQAIISELFGEKIDIIPYSAMMDKFIAASLSPAKVIDVELDEEEQRALVTVPEDQQSLAIGREGQNARLANKLTRWKIDIKGTTGVFGEGFEESGDVDDSAPKAGVWDAAIKAVEAQQAKESEEEAAKEEPAVSEGEESAVDHSPEGETTVDEDAQAIEEAAEQIEEAEDTNDNATEEDKVETDDSEEESK